MWKIKFQFLLFLSIKDTFCHQQEEIDKREKDQNNNGNQSKLKDIFMWVEEEMGLYSELISSIERKP